jgi:hypothetical protein
MPMKTGLSVAAVAALLAVQAEASSLFAVSGAFTGNGRIAPEVDAAMERARCRIDVVPAAGGGDISITGQCVFTAASTDISMRFLRGSGSQVRAGVRSPSSGETVQFSGRDTGDTVRLQTTEAIDVEGVAYSSIVTLEFASERRFSMEQIVREAGQENWVRVVDMTFEKD